MENETTKKNYKDTLNLPRTTFPMKAGLPQKEPQILKSWDGEDVYEKILASRKSSGKTFVLHDGPPYANGNIHMGHVLNKILKDICVKYFAMKGHEARYVPGWDCHGLPVEHQLFKELEMTKNDIGQVEFRKKAYKYAMKYVRIQAKEFKRLGIFGDWDNPYLTLTKDYEANILHSLAKLYDRGYIYKGLKPVNWCKECETALAEAEVEYENKTSPSIYVKFRSKLKIEGKDTFFVIWTTTPWTLLANVAVALKPDFEYSYVKVGDEVWVLLDELIPSLFEKFGIEDHTVISTFSGSDIVRDVKAVEHPFIERDSVLVLADYVTNEEGTGCVHTAPGHGQDDYMTGKKYDLPVIMPVDDKGCFTSDTPLFAGEDVFKANAGITEKMRNEGTLIREDAVSHSYPHCWRCKSPIIFRATEQWFMSIDHEGLRDKLEQKINEGVNWIPASGKERIGAMVKNRPDWCLSRQRYWGVPIPAVKCDSCSESFTSTEIIKKTAELAETEGATVWFEKDVKEFLPDGLKCGKCGASEFTKEEDILDVWFDSGVSHQAVLESRSELKSPADLYLEGSDQHRGWFQASLITSMGINGEAPFKNVLTHGFVVDGEGKKMSKSIGNVISPNDVMVKYGADILRLWVASSDYEGDIKISDEILARLSDGYRKIRNTFRFLLSNLNDYDPEKDPVEHKDLPEIDKWMLSRLYAFLGNINDHYDSWEFYKAYRAVYDFCVTEVSSFYLDISKDILYIYAPDSIQRRSVQTVLFRILDILTRVMAPIMAFTAEEVWGHINAKDKEESVHMALWPELTEAMGEWENKDLDEKWDKIIEIRDVVMKVLEEKRSEGLIGSSLEAKISLFSEDETMKSFIENNIEIFPLLFRVSQAVVLDQSRDGMSGVEGMPLEILVNRADGEKCPRCWNYCETVGTNEKFPDLCERCYNVMIERS